MSFFSNSNTVELSSVAAIVVVVFSLLFDVRSYFELLLFNFETFSVRTHTKKKEIVKKEEQKKY